MKRQILCLDCATLPMLHDEDVIAGFHSYRMKGTAKGNYFCDKCNKRIKPEEICVAESIMQKHEERYFWEQDYLHYHEPVKVSPSKPNTVTNSVTENDKQS